MNRRTKLIIGGIVVLCVLLLVWLFVRGRGTSPQTVTGQNVLPTTSAPIPSPQAATPATPVISPEAQAQAVADVSLEGFVRSFVERFGSYSTQNHFENLKDLYPSMTAHMQAYAKTLERAPQSQAYVGVTTQALSVTLSNLTETGARATVTTQRSQRKGSAAPVISYPTIDLDLIKEGGDWKVDRAVWR